MTARNGVDGLVVRMHSYASALARLAGDGTLTRESLGRSLRLQWMVTTPLQQLGEAAWLLQKAGADLGREVPLRQIAALRHRLVHHYDGIDWSVAEGVVFEDVPALVEALEAVMAERGLEPEELDLS